MNVPIWLCIPFAGLLLCVALFPLFAPNWWGRHESHMVILWSVISIVLFATQFGAAETFHTEFDCIINDYLTFIILLFGLFCVAGNISFTGDLAGSPGVNVVLLTIGTLLSSVIGTTGSSMLMIRPVIKMNSWRKRKSQIIIFFIFLVSNIGGCLTPMGDPPLLMGFMRGVPFLWSFNLFPVLLVNMFLLLTLFFFIDRKNYRKDIAEGRRPDLSSVRTMIRFEGLHNIIFLVMIVIGVVLSGLLPGLKAFQDASGNVLGITFPGNVSLTYPSLIEIIIILLAAYLSFKTTNKEVRVHNHFTWGAIEEVAVLFIGIFITMQPALILLKAKGSTLGLTTPVQMFFATGALSSFLDNTPTYLVFLTTAGSLGFKSGLALSVGTVSKNMLMAISCGAVFMGANTYIGNAPNFMVKSMSDENGITMPSFFGYMKWSICILVPVFIIDALIFFM
ncbi:MAG: sodium:proton antiporter [Lachnospiraceae bacterium]|nr:sodium:proton antiporter [Lachnospiraceae bacterium]